MAQILPGHGIDVNAIADGTLDAEITGVTFAKTDKGDYIEVSIHHHAFVAQIGEGKYNVPEATNAVNIAAVLTATTYYCYYKLVAGVMTWVSTTEHPDLASPEVEDYVWVREIRIVAPDGDIATCFIEYVVRHTCTHEEFCHEISDSTYLQPPIYINGLATTFSATGQISSEVGKYGRLVGGVRGIVAVTNGVIFSPGGAENVANLEAITHYGDGTGDITADKWVKALVGLIVNDASDYDYILNVQGKPATQYASAVAAWSDAENKAPTGFSSTRRGAVLPVAWVVFQVGECAAMESRDIREMGVTTVTGAATGVTNHAGLSNLNVLADHELYLAVDGSRTLTGDMLVTAGKKIDGVDISAHAADTSIHHVPITITAGVDGILGLSTQQLTLDTQVKNTILAGPTTGADAAPAFRTLSHVDITDFHTEAAADAAALDHAAVTLAASATPILGLSTQEISFDTQTASAVLAGPVVGEAAAAPTFRVLNIQDIARPSGTLTLATGANNNVTLTAGTRVYTVAGPTNDFSITGFTGGTDGAILYIYNSTAEDMTFVSQSLNSTNINRLILVNATNNSSGPGVATFIYIAGTLNRWIMASIAA